MSGFYQILERGKRKESTEETTSDSSPVVPFPICQVDAAENGSSRNALYSSRRTQSPKRKQKKKEEEEEIEKRDSTHTAHTQSPAHCVINDQAKKGKMRKTSSSSSSSPGQTQLVSQEHSTWYSSIFPPFSRTHSTAQSNQAFIFPLDLLFSSISLCAILSVCAPCVCVHNSRQHLFQ